MNRTDSDTGTLDFFGVRTGFMADFTTGDAADGHDESSLHHATPR